MISDTPDPVAVGRRIRALRRRHHLTQAALATKVGIRTGPMNTLENGHHLPSLPVLCRLAAVLHTTADGLLDDAPSRYVVREKGSEYAVREPERPLAAPVGDYRACCARIIRFEPDREPLSDEMVQTLDRVVSAFLALEDLCGVAKTASVPLTLQLPRSENGLPGFASRVRALFGIRDAIIFDYLELFENAGFRVVFLPLPETVESISCYDRDCENAFFFIASGINVERQLFRLCYELGRIYLYTGGLAVRGKIGTLDGEHAARRFGALYLMPEEAVRDTVRQVGVGPDRWTWPMLMRLKHRFGVSAEAFLYRLSELDLIDADVVKTLRTQIYAYYDAHAYAEPDATRRILTPNGRLGDLLLSARHNTAASRELDDLRRTLKLHGIETP